MQQGVSMERSGWSPWYQGGQSVWGGVSKSRSWLIVVEDQGESTG